MEINTLDGNKPILWVKANEEEEGIQEFLNDLDHMMTSQGYDFTFLFTPKAFDLSTLSQKNLIDLLDPNALLRAGYFKEDVLLAVLLAIGEPVKIADSIQEYIKKNRRKLNVHWKKMRGGQSVEIEKKEPVKGPVVKTAKKKKKGA